MNLLPPDPNHQFGALYRAPDPRDWHLEREVRVAAQLAVGIPERFMVMPIEDVRVIYSQNGPSCVSNSICGAKSIEDFKDLGAWQKYDADQLYKACGGDGINGIFADTALHYTRDIGCLEPTTGQRFKIDSYYFAPQSREDWRETLAAALVATGPCVVAMLVPSMFGWDSNESMTSGYHQMCLVGYEGLGDNDYAIFLNSWGLSGNKGFYRLRWRYLEGNSFQSNHVYGYKLVDADDPNSIPDPPPDPNHYSLLGRVAKAKPGKLSIVPDDFAVNIKGRRVSGVTIEDDVLSFSGKVKASSEDLIVLKGEFESSLEMKRVQVQTI